MLSVLRLECFKAPSFCTCTDSMVFKTVPGNRDKKVMDWINVGYFKCCARTHLLQEKIEGNVCYKSNTFEVITFYVIIILLCSITLIFYIS